MSPARTALLGRLLLVTLIACRIGGGASAEPTHKAKHSIPARPAHAAPDVTATIAKPMPAPDTAGDRDIPPPIMLPTASRKTVRACGEAWRDRKLAGTTGDEDWRDFAMKCLVDGRPDAPPH